MEGNFYSFYFCQIRRNNQHTLASGVIIPLNKLLVNVTSFLLLLTLIRSSQSSGLVATRLVILMHEIADVVFIKKYKTKDLKLLLLLLPCCT